MCNPLFVDKLTYIAWKPKPIIFAFSAFCQPCKNAKIALFPFVAPCNVKVQHIKIAVSHNFKSLNSY